MSEAPNFDPILQLDSVRLSYHLRTGEANIVPNLNLTLRRGEALGLVGESGSGKSTIAYALMRYLGPHGRIAGGRILFEGRDSDGKGGVIKRITQRLNPRVCRIAALPAPNERERTQWYFQRYVAHLPASGEIVLFDRSWYNRAGVELVMGFCTEEQVEEFFRSVPEFERMLVRSGTILLKYWFSITDEEQQFRFLMRIHDPLKQWKLSPMDVQARARWEQYTKAKEEMLRRTRIPEAPWWVLEADDKKRARLNCISHLLSQIPYHDVQHPPVVLPPRIHHANYHRGPIPPDMYVPARF